MKIDYEITKQDFISYNLHYVENLKSGKKKMNIIRIFTALCFGYVASLLWIVLFEYDFYFSCYSGFIGIVVGLIWFFVYPKIYKWQINNSAKNMVDEYQNSDFISKRSVTVDEENITIKSEISTQIIKKRFIKEVKKYPDMILIYFEGMTVAFIPTRFLQGDLKYRFLKELGCK